MHVPSLQDLLEVGLHFGHQAKRWNPRMEKFIYQKRDNIHIIDLVKTHEQLQKAADFTKQAVAEGKIVLFLGTKHQAQDIIVKEAMRCGMPYLEKRWIGGLITNWDQIKRNIDKLNQYSKEKQTGELARYTKKEQLLMERKMHKLNNELGGLAHLTKLPDVLFVVDPKKEANAVYEAGKRNITTIALCDTNTNPDTVTFPIPGNDDSIKSLQLVTKTIADAVEEGRRVFEKQGGQAKQTLIETQKVTAEPVVINADDIIEAVVEEIEGAVLEAEEQQIHRLDSEAVKNDTEKTARPKSIKAATAKTEAERPITKQPKTKATTVKTGSSVAAAKVIEKPKTVKKPAVKKTAK